MYSSPKQKDPQVDILIPDRDGHLVSLDGMIQQLEDRKEKIEKQVDNYQQRIKVTQKLIKNLKLDSMRSTWSLVISMACLSALLTHNQLARKVAFTTVATTAVVNPVAMVVLSKQRKNLKQQKTFLEEQERSLA
ncbi:MAG: hypothetical protein J6T55_00680 [Alphaproteobacteria bacterium]|nr:hypothetical protein [Alphaproteobacteria bacterium]